MSQRAAGGCVPVEAARPDAPVDFGHACGASGVWAKAGHPAPMGTCHGQRPETLGPRDPQAQGGKAAEIHARARQFPLPDEPQFARFSDPDGQRTDCDCSNLFRGRNMGSQPCRRREAEDHDRQRRKAPAGSPHAEGSTNSRGSSRASCHLIDQCRCGPVARPDAPIRPICWPWVTCSPCSTSIRSNVFIGWMTSAALMPGAITGNSIARRAVVRTTIGVLSLMVRFAGASVRCERNVEVRVMPGTSGSVGKRQVRSKR